MFSFTFTIVSINIFSFYSLFPVDFLVVHLRIFYKFVVSCFNKF